jgi:hypothetical protein
MTDKIFINERNQKVDYNQYEKREIDLIKKFIKEDDVVLELGARYGGTSVAINQILKDKEKQVSVDPDERIWESLETNKKNHNCHFMIIKGTISNKPQKIIKDSRKFADNNDWATYTESASQGEVQGSSVKNYPLPLLNLNVLVADCEGFLETFYDENKNMFPYLRLIIFEKDRPDFCNYDRLINEFKMLGFKCIQNDFHSVFMK